MFERFGSGLSGTYRITDAELAKDKKVRCVSISVQLLDDTAKVFQIEKKAKGNQLLDLVFNFLELSERDYFGLQFCYSPEVVRWLDPNKAFRKQWNAIKDCIENGNSVIPSLEFKVKFYVNDPCNRLQEEYTRYQFYLQIKKDIWTGKLPISLHTACLLASYSVQGELGDFNAIEHVEGYLSDLQLLVDQNEENERRICELHKLHRGQLPGDAELNYLEHAKRLEMYGIDFHKATDSAGKDLLLGVASIGLLVYQNNLRVNTFSWTKMVKVSFKRKDFFIQLRREPSESYDTLLGFSMGSHKNAKVLWKSCVENHSFFRLQKPHRSPRFLPLTLGSKFHYSGRTELQTVLESKQRTKGVSKVFVRSPSKRHITSPMLNGSSDASNGLNGNKKSRPMHDNKITVAQTLPRKAWEPQSDDEGGFIERCAIPPLFDSPPAYNSSENTNQLTEEGLVTIRLVADEQGRYGFNVKGGIDLQMPILVSRVAPNTPADRSNPKIAEGDQVLMINGHDVNSLKHDQVVNLIRNSREYRGGELCLTIKPNTLVDFSGGFLEPIYQYVPENGNNPSIFLGAGDDAFSQSLMLLSDGISSGSLMTQYEKMYRKNSDLAITEARKAENVNKNRYRDISPYDCTRVVLLNCENGDYINANYVNMEIPNGAINRYIATQGPLSSTVLDFWKMVQQESCHLVVMLTTVLERGRIKCHQYWPSNGETLELGDGFSIQCFSEKADKTGSFVFRDLLLKDVKSSEERTIQHMQYMSWPDHGVPANPTDFLEFTEKVRLARNTTLLQEIEATLKQVKLKDADENGGIDGERPTDGESPCELPASTSVHQCISAANPPIIIHCSAGIGRTGVLILMDTALALMEAKEPVYPLDIVQAMRDQRACMVQNVAQYRFVCECIVAAYGKMINTAIALKEETEEEND